MEENNKKITVKKILEITKGILLSGKEEFVIKTFSKDTRNIEEGDFYLGIKGEKFNGSVFYEDALKKGAIGALVQDIEISKEVLQKYTDKVIIKVENVLESMQKIAEYKRNLYSIPVVAITGSVGKTSTKDIVASVMEEKFDVLKTQGNLNNHIGLPFTILKLDNHDAMVIEMGMNNFGEIRTLTNIAKPTFCIITNIGTEHIGNLGSRENILKAKLEILEGMQNGGTLLVNNDNDLLHKWVEENKGKVDLNILTYGIENKSDYMAHSICKKEEGSIYKIDIKGKTEQIIVPVPGMHFVYNSLCSIAVGDYFNIDVEKVKQGIEKFKLTKSRMDIEKIRDNITVINDSYNANFDSMKSALEYLGSLKNRKIAVLGDMLELGEYAKDLHEKVGEEVVKNKIDILVCVGDLAKNIAIKCKSLGMNDANIIYLDNKEEAIKLLNSILKENDNVLLKASNSMKFYEILDYIK